MFLPGSKIVVCDSNHCDERFVPVAHSTNVPVDVKIATSQVEAVRFWKSNGTGPNTQHFCCHCS